ncbi:hypothetical protein MRX96_051225, partial [Rhipicephalus microplus]
GSLLVGLEQVRSRDKSESSLRVLQLSDTHYDPEYTEGSLAACDAPLCCQPDSGEVQNDTDRAGRWGDFRHCDLPFRTLDSMLEHVGTHERKPDFAYWTGDLPPHDLWKVTRATNLKNFVTTTAAIGKRLPGLTVYPVVGNHESVPPNMFPESGHTDAQIAEKSKWLYNTLADDWKVWLPEDAVATLHWLVDQLLDAERVGDKVHLIGHIPPGLSDCLETWSAMFHKIVERFSDTVVGQFYGHTHYDEAIVYYSSAKRSRPFGLAFVAPSVTTYSFLNPAYRMYDVDSDSKLVTRHETYFMNLTEANQDGGEPQWRLEYSTDDLGLDHAGYEDWDALIRTMETNQTRFDQYVRYTTRREGEETRCDDECRELLVCRWRTDRAHDYSACPRDPTATVVIRSPGRHRKALVKLPLAVVFPDRSGTLHSSLAPGSPQTAKHHDTKKRRSSVRRSDRTSLELDGTTSRLWCCQASRNAFQSDSSEAFPERQDPGDGAGRRAPRAGAGHLCLVQAGGEAVDEHVVLSAVTGFEVVGRD